MLAKTDISTEEEEKKSEDVHIRLETPLQSGYGSITVTNSLCLFLSGPDETADTSSPSD